MLTRPETTAALKNVCLHKIRACDCEVKERFLGFIDVRQLDAGALATSIGTFLEDIMQLHFKIVLVNRIIRDITMMIIGIRDVWEKSWGPINYQISAYPYVHRLLFSIALPVLTYGTEALSIGKTTNSIRLSTA